MEQITVNLEEITIKLNFLEAIFLYSFLLLDAEQLSHALFLKSKWDKMIHTVDIKKY